MWTAARRAAVVAVWAGLLVTAAHAQSVIGYLNPFGSERGGLKLYSVSMFGGYFSGGTPGLQQFVPNNREPSGSVGASGTLGWSRSRGTTNFSVTYSGSFITQVPDTTVHAFNHAFNFATSGSKQIAPRLKWTLGGAANLTTLDTFLYAPTQQNAVALTPSTFDELSAGVLTGRYGTNSQLALALTGSPALESALRPLLYGYRTFSTSLSTGLTYSFSPRLNLSVGVNASRTQHIASDEDTDARYEYLIPHTTTGGANVGLSYAMSPKTNVGVGASVSRTFARTLDAYYTSVQFNASRVLGRKWFIQGHGGAGFVTEAKPTAYRLPQGVNYTAGGGIGYRTRSHAFLGSADRTFGDQYSYGAGSTLTASGTWTWSRPGSQWTTFASIGTQWLTGSAVQQVSGWRAGAGLGRALSQHLSMNAQYSYITYVNPFVTGGNDYYQNGVLIALVWSPQRIR